MLSPVAYCVAPVFEDVEQARRPHKRLPFDFLGALIFAALGFLVMGYHPGLEDDGIYLTAVKADLNPALFPFNANFFRLQLQASAFDPFMAGFIRCTRIPVAWAEFIWQCAALVLILWAAKKIANRLFDLEHARWAGVAMLAAMFTLPVTGTALYLVDQHLHPRTLATALILLAVWRILDHKLWQAPLLLLPAFLLHPLMAAMGISFCFFLGFFPGLGQDRLGSHPVRSWQTSAAVFIPLGWVFEPGNPDWKRAVDTRAYEHLFQWTWYEWLGALAPLVLFWLLWRFALSRGRTTLARFAFAILLYGLFQQILAIVALWPAALVRLTPLQPMRYLHLVYFFLVLIAGCLLGEFVLKRSIWRWAAFLLIANGSMLAGQRVEFAASQHLEMPWRQPANPWLQAFAWVRMNTPENAYFALDPQYLASPGEDYHSFRALAERSSLADVVKDASVVTMVPELGPEWVRQTTATQGWANFGLADFERLKQEFGVGWVLVSSPAPAGLACNWHNAELAVCQIP
ncbi:MAG TPA: hypothetical protein VMT38_12925 [Terracidiphilus sp.]|nr:hypothetical protein [Terracidiphilus sp.]